MQFFAVSRRNILLIILAAAIVLAGAVLAGRYLPVFSNNSGFLDDYLLLPDKVSKSASLRIRLPRGVAIKDAAWRVSFEPQIRGAWVENTGAGELVFDPADPLPVGHRFVIQLNAPEAELKKEFLVEEDPKITAIFPGSGEEANEFSNITLVFSRPMVVLSSFKEMEAAAKRAGEMIEIQPKTPGRFRWVTSRNLQFEPEKRLRRASEYTLKVREGLRSAEDLPVPALTHIFKTRPLRQEAVSQASTLNFDEPIRIFFNQPIDLVRTEKEISLTRSSMVFGPVVETGMRGLSRPPQPVSVAPASSVLPVPAGDSVPFRVSYGKRSITDPDGRVREVLDQRILEIRPKQDRFGRGDKWDFGGEYYYLIKRAFPLEGELGWDSVSGGNIRIDPLLREVSAVSPRSEAVFPDVFDPEGELVLSFAEEVDKDRLRLSGLKVKDKKYGEKCRLDQYGNQIWSGSSCEKEPDLKTIKVAFSPDGLDPGKKVALKLEQVRSLSGIELNAEPVPVEIAAYPGLRISKTSPDSSSRGAEPTGFDICSTTPLKPAEENNFSERFRSSLPYGRWNWSSSRRIGETEENPPCAPKEFYTRLQIGLAPSRSLTAVLRPVDDFGQSAEVTLDFTTGPAPENSRNFFHMQGVYQAASRGKTTLTYAVENLPYVDLTVCEVSPETMLKYAGDLPPATSPISAEACSRTVSRRISLPDRYWTRNYFQIKLADLVGNVSGHFILTMTNPEHRRVIPVWNPEKRRMDRQLGGLVYERTFLTVTELAVVEKRVEWQGESGYDENPEYTKNALAIGPRSLYWVSRLGSLEPVSGAAVSVYGDGLNVLSKAETNREGFAETAVQPNVRGAVVRLGNDSAVVAASTDRLNWSGSAASPETVYVYTDRPIYRPGEQVEIKGIHRIGFDGNYEILNGRRISFIIYDARGTVAKEDSAVLSKQGTFTASFLLPEGAPLGSYSIAVGRSGYGSFDVEEYQPAPFEVKVQTDKEEYLAKDTVRAEIYANYYFGVPVEGGEVEYSVLSQDYYFDRYSGSDFDFGGSWYFGYQGGYGDKFITRGKTRIASDGRATVSLPLDFAKLFREEEGQRSKLFTLEFTAKNRNGQAVSGRSTFIVHRGEHYLGLDISPRFSPLAKDQPVTVKVKSVDTAGKAKSVRNVLAKTNRITWQSVKRREVDGRYYWISEEKKETVSEQILATDTDGNASFKFSPPREGEYEVHLSGEDSKGNQVQGSSRFYVHGQGLSEVRQMNNETLEIEPESSEVKAGGSLAAILKSPFPSGKALVTLERGHIFERRVVDVQGSFARVVFEVRPEYVPNVTLSALILSPEGGLRFGQAEYRVGTERVTLSVEAKPDKNVYLPGEQVRLSLLAKDSEGRGVPAELSVAVADLSVLALKGNPKKNPVLFFYGGQPLTVTTAANVKNMLVEADIPAGTKGGGAPEELAKRKRGDFRSTAFWQGSVKTDRLGRAEIVFTLPDNLTTWQVESVGVTEDTRLGVGYSEIQTRKELMLVPLTPRFLLPEDKFSIGAKVFNQSEQELNIKVSYRGTNSVSSGEYTNNIRLRPGETETVYYKLNASADPGPGERFTFSISAESGDLVDSVEKSIPYGRNQIPEVTATAGYSVAEETREYLFVPGEVLRDGGSAKLTIAGTFAVFLEEALGSLFDSPDLLSGDISAKLAAIALAERGSKTFGLPDPPGMERISWAGRVYPPKEAVSVGLAKLEEMRSIDGGFAYYPNLRPDFYLTREVLDALLMVRSAGFEVPDRLIQGAATYLSGELTRKDLDSMSYLEDPDTVIAASYTLARVPGFNLPQTLRDLVSEYAVSAAWREKLSSGALAYLAGMDSGAGLSNSARQAVFRTLDSRVQIDGRGASLPDRGEPSFSRIGGPIRNTALFVKMSARTGRDSPLLERVLRWLSRSRSFPGGWGSSRDTLTVADALCDYLTWKREMDSNFSLTVKLNGEERRRFEIDPKSILSSLELSLPFGNLVPDRVHTLSLTKNAKNGLPNGYYYDLTLEYFLPILGTPPRDEGFTITRSLYRLGDTSGERPVSSAKQGEVVRGRIILTVPEERAAVEVEDFIPAGMELINFRLATVDRSLSHFEEFREEGESSPPEAVSQPTPEARGTWGWLRDQLFGWGSAFGKKVEPMPDAAYAPDESKSALYPEVEELRDDRLFLFRGNISPGVYHYDYFLRALIPGEYRVPPARVRQTDFPEIFGRTAGSIFRIDPGVDVSE